MEFRIHFSPHPRPFRYTLLRLSFTHHSRNFGSTAVPWVFSRAVGCFGVGRRPTYLRPQANFCSRVNSVASYIGYTYEEKGLLYWFIWRSKHDVNFLRLSWRVRNKLTNASVVPSICVHATCAEGNAHNRPFPSSTNSHFKNEAKCKTFVEKMSFICMRTKNSFSYQSLCS